MRSGPSKGDALGLGDLTVGEVLEHLPDPLLVLGADWAVLYVNVAAERLLNCCAAELVGTNLSGCVSRGGGIARGVRACAAGWRDRAVHGVLCAVGALVLGAGGTAADGSVGVLHDISALKAAEQRAARLAEVLAAREKVASAIAAREELSGIFALVCRESVELLNGSNAWLMRSTERGYEVVKPLPSPMPRGWV